MTGQARWVSRSLLSIVFVATALACGGPGADPHGGPGDGAAEDAARRDAATDASTEDAGWPVDDAGWSVDDAGASDAGSSDAGWGDAGSRDAGGPRDAGAPRDAGPPPVDAGPAGPLVLYVAPGGDDARDGSTPARAVLTLARVHAILVSMRPDRDVEVRIAPGTYHGQRVRWTYTMPDHSIRFVTSAADRTRPVFDGCLASGECPGGTWFLLASSSGRPTNLEFEYLRVTRYQTAIALNGSRESRSTSNGRNRIFGCYFDRIGNGFAPSLPYSTAALRLVNSDDNVIENNHFVDVINTTSGALIHAIYAAHGSDRNRIARNRFLRSTGDPVRIRDFSNGNVVVDNRFIRVGTAAGYTDWYCDHDTRSDCTSPLPECPSWDNQFRDNVLDGTWACRTLAVWELFQDDSATGCSRPTASSRRVRTSGNTQTATPCSME